MTFDTLVTNSVSSSKSTGTPMLLSVVLAV